MSSIRKETEKSIRAVRASLKAFGVDVPEVDGASDDLPLKGLQEWQAVEGGLKAHQERSAAPEAVSGKKAN